MADQRNNGISWTDETWNPVRGCSIVSEGCRNCYAMRQAHRMSGPGKAYEGLTRLTQTGPKWTGKIRVVDELIDKPLRWQRPRRIFVNSMSDLFHREIRKFDVAAIFRTMMLADHHVFQVLTKRPEPMQRWLNDTEFQEHVYHGDVGVWPLPNVWLGVSCGDQASADERIPLLLDTPAAIRWVSAEPLLGPIDFRRVPGFNRIGLDLSRWWVVVGGESGPGARPMHPDWARSIRDQCVNAGVAFCFKQWGQYGWVEQMPGETVLEIDAAVNLAGHPDHDKAWGVGKKRAGRELDGRTWDEYPEVRT